MHSKLTSIMNQFKYKLPSCPTQISKLEKFINKVTCNCNCTKSKYGDILVSITEAVNNAIIHGNNKDKNKFVNIQFEKSDSKLIFLITDEGSGFDPREVKDPTSPEKIADCGGRGVFIMKQLCDKLAYHNNGSTVELQFNLSESY